MAYWYCPNCKNAVLGQNVTFEELHDTCGTPVICVDVDSPILLTKEIAWDIWEAAQEHLEDRQFGGPNITPDFDTFYQQLTEQKQNDLP